MPRIKLPPKPQCELAPISTDLRTLADFAQPTFAIKPSSRIYLSGEITFGAGSRLHLGMRSRLEISNCLLHNCVVVVEDRCVLILKNCKIEHSLIICDLRMRICTLENLALTHETYKVVPDETKS